MCLVILRDHYLRQVSSQREKIGSGYAKVLSLSHISKREKKKLGYLVDSVSDTKKQKAKSN